MDRSPQPPVAVEFPTGIWHSKYRYPSSSRHGVFENEHFISLKRERGSNEYVFESLPNANTSHLVVRLTVEGTVATGSWREETEKNGYYKGSVYSGAIQLVVDEDGRYMHGKWVGFGKDRTVNVGAWEFTFVGKELPAGLRLAKVRQAHRVTESNSA